MLISSMTMAILMHRWLWCWYCCYAILRSLVESIHRRRFAGWSLTQLPPLRSVIRLVSLRSVRKLIRDECSYDQLATGQNEAPTVEMVTALSTAMWHLLQIVVCQWNWLKWRSYLWPHKSFQVVVPKTKSWYALAAAHLGKITVRSDVNNSWGHSISISNI